MKQKIDKAKFIANLGNKAWEFWDMFVFLDMTLATLFCGCEPIAWTVKW